MPSNGWKNIVGKDWASCVLHNLPFLYEKRLVEKPEVRHISIRGLQSASSWNWHDFKEKGCLKR